MEHFAALNIAVNNAGVGSPFHKVADVDLSDWQRVIDINLSGVLWNEISNRGNNQSKRRKHH